MSGCILMILLSILIRGDPWGTGWWVLLYTDLPVSFTGGFCTDLRVINILVGIDSVISSYLRGTG